MSFTEEIQNGMGRREGDREREREREGAREEGGEGPKLRLRGREGAQKRGERAHQALRCGAETSFYC